jgi:heat shock protein HtpX
MYSEIASNKRKTWLIMFFFFVLIGGLGYIFSMIQNTPMLTPYIMGGAALYALFQYYLADKVALSVNQAVEIRQADNPRLWKTVENLAITNGMPMPRVYIMDDPAPNAFATGRDPSHAAVCATSGLLSMMTDSELQGVMAHELGHVQNYDIRVSMIAFGLVSAIGLLSDVFLRMMFWGGDDDSSNSNGLFMVLGIIAAILTPIVATLLQLAVSRNREYLADATGVMTTRYPEGLESALQKIAGSSSMLKKQTPSTAHLFFANPLKAHSFAGLFSTHPPIEDRIAKLKKMGKTL